MKRICVGLTIACVFLLVCISLTPAQFFVHLADPTNAHLRSPSGSIWSGNTQIFIRDYHLGNLIWNLEHKELYKGHFRYRVSLVGDGLDVSGHVSVGWTEQEIDLNGIAEARASNRLLSYYEIDITGQIEIADLYILSDTSTNNLRSTKGQVDWEGGPVHYRLSNLAHRTEMPPLSGEIISHDAIHSLHVREQHDARSILTVQFDFSTTEMKIIATNRFIKVTQAPWMANSNDYGVAFTLSERLTSL